MRMVASAGNANIHAAPRNIIRHNPPCRIHPFVPMVVVPKPKAFHNITVSGRIVIPSGVRIDKTGGIINTLDGTMPLNVG